MDRTCDHCNGIILKGATHNRIVNEVIQDYSRHDDPDSLCVLSSDEVLILCDECSRTYNTQLLKKLLKHLPKDRESVKHN